MYKNILHYESMGSIWLVFQNTTLLSIYHAIGLPPKTRFYLVGFLEENPQL